MSYININDSNEANSLSTVSETFCQVSSSVAPGYNYNNGATLETPLAMETGGGNGYSYTGYTTSSGDWSLGYDGGWQSASSHFSDGQQLDSSAPGVSGTVGFCSTQSTNWNSMVGYQYTSTTTVNATEKEPDHSVTGYLEAPLAIKRLLPKITREYARQSILTYRRGLATAVFISVPKEDLATELLIAHVGQSSMEQEADYLLGSRDRGDQGERLHYVLIRDLQEELYVRLCPQELFDLVSVWPHSKNCAKRPRPAPTDEQAIGVIFCFPTTDGFGSRIVDKNVTKRTLLKNLRLTLPTSFEDKIDDLNLGTDYAATRLVLPIYQMLENGWATGAQLLHLFIDPIPLVLIEAELLGMVPPFWYKYVSRRIILHVLVCRILRLNTYKGRGSYHGATLACRFFEDELATYQKYLQLMKSKECAMRDYYSARPNQDPLNHAVNIPFRGPFTEFHHTNFPLRYQVSPVAQILSEALYAPVGLECADIYRPESTFFRPEVEGAPAEFDSLRFMCLFAPDYAEQLLVSRGYEWPASISRYRYVYSTRQERRELMQLREFSDNTILWQNKIPAVHTVTRKSYCI